MNSRVFFYYRIQIKDILSILLFLHYTFLLYWLFFLLIFADMSTIPGGNCIKVLHFWLESHCSSPFLPSFKKYLFVCLFISVPSVLPACVPAGQKRAPNLITDGCRPPCCCWELDSGPLEDQSVLLTSLSLSSLRAPPFYFVGSDECNTFFYELK